LNPCVAQAEERPIPNRRVGSSNLPLGVEGDTMLGLDTYHNMYYLDCDIDPILSALVAEVKARRAADAEGASSHEGHGVDAWETPCCACVALSQVIAAMAATDAIHALREAVKP
jgi:hypothetical protein